MIRGPQKPTAIRNLRGLFEMFRDGRDLKYMKGRNVPRWLWTKENEEKEKRFRDFYRRTP